jgi:hypothetical protein
MIKSNLSVALGKKPGTGVYPLETTLLSEGQDQFIDTKVSNVVECFDWDKVLRELGHRDGEESTDIGLQMVE